MRLGIKLKQICKKIPYEEFSGVKKDKKDCSEAKSKKTNMGAGPNLLKFV